MGLIALVTGTGNTNCTRLCLMPFHALPVPVTRAINPHIALSTVLVTIHIVCLPDLHVYTKYRTWSLYLRRKYSLSFSEGYVLSEDAN